MVLKHASPALGKPSSLSRLAQRRAQTASKQDVENMAKMAHMLSEIEVVGRVLTCAEIDPRIEPLRTTLLLHKPSTSQ